MSIITDLRTSTVNALQEANERHEKRLKFIDEYATQILLLEEGLEPVKSWIVGNDIDTANQCLDLRFAGDKHTLEGVFAALRRMNYVPSSRPKDDKLTDFSCWWEKDVEPFDKSKQLRLWVNFTSTVCKRVKVGTKMVEQDVYEIVCE